MMAGIGSVRWLGPTGTAALAVLLLAGCAAAPRSEPPSYGKWRADAGEPVDRIRFSNLIDWQPLDRDWILLRFNGGQSFALRPRDPCLADVREAKSLELLSAMTNLLHRSDRVRLDHNVCLIEEIRALSATSTRGLHGGGHISQGY